MRIDIQEPDEVKDRAAVRKDAVVHALVNARPAQINNWVNNNVTNIASTKTVLKVILRILVALLRDRLK